MRLLVVDDESHVCHLLESAFKAEGFAVDSACDGEDGERLALTNDYDIIVLDNHLPRKNGVQVVQTLRSNNRHVPIIILSVIADAYEKAQLINSGADDYLTKPYSYEELLARVRALLRRPKRLENDVLVLGDLTLDTKRHNVQCGARPITLTLKEFSLLEYLMRNPGVVLTRGMLMEHVWNMNIDPFSNTVDSHIASLRKKLGTQNTKRIETISGKGYKINF